MGKRGTRVHKSCEPRTEVTRGLRARELGGLAHHWAGAAICGGDAMTAAELSGTDEEHAEAALIAAAARDPERGESRRCRRISSPRCSASRFPRISCVTNRASSPSWRRTRGHCSRPAQAGRAENPPSTRRGTARPHAQRRSQCVLEIVNDDMPFLVDSVLGRAGRARARSALRGASRVHVSSAMPPAV